LKRAADAKAKRLRELKTALEAIEVENAALEAVEARTQTLVAARRRIAMLEAETDDDELGSDEEMAERGAFAEAFGGAGAGIILASTSIQYTGSYELCLP
jgi:hypothetical protein